MTCPPTIASVTFAVPAVGESCAEIEKAASRVIASVKRQRRVPVIDNAADFIGATV
jgi:hypothetical protein